MFKKALFFTALFFSISPAFAGNGDSESVSSDKVGYFGHGAERTSYVLRTSSSGHIFSDFDGRNELGTPNYNWGKIHLADNGIITSTGVTRHQRVFIDLPAKDDDIIYESPAISLSLLASGTSYAGTILTQPAIPRNIIVSASVTVSAVSMTSASVSGTVYIAGIDHLGRSTFTYQSLVSTSNAAAGVGSIAWSHISSVTVSAVSTGTVIIDGNSVRFQIGTGDKIGLGNKIDNTNDIYKAIELGVDRSTATAQTSDAFFSTYNPLIVPNGTNDYEILYIQKYFTPLP